MLGLNEDFVDILEGFLARGVEFVVVGARRTSSAKAAAFTEAFARARRGLRKARLRRGLCSRLRGALAAHGIARATGDLDVFVRASPENAARVYQALGDFGTPLPVHRP